MKCSFSVIVDLKHTHGTPYFLLPTVVDKLIRNFKPI